MKVTTDSPVASLTRSALGKSLSLSKALELLESMDAPSAVKGAPQGLVRLGSIGYEKHREVDAFAQLIAAAGIERLIDVRELPISRRKGFAKTALSNALEDHGVEYIHLRSMGNPKEFRDLYKSGRVYAGRLGFEKLLLRDRLDELALLAEMIREKPAALMCVEDEEDVCHRRVILDALESEVGLKLEVIQIS